MVIKTNILSLESLSTTKLKEYFSRLPVAIPTETVYGLASPISNTETTAMIYAIKNRPQVNPLILHISNLNMLKTLITFVPDCYEPLIKKFWPGPLSLIFEPSQYTKKYIQSDFICIRMPSNTTALSIIEKLNEPLFAPSANLSGKISPTTSKHVLDDLDGKIELIIEGGQSVFGLESTIFDFRSMKVLRPGVISEEEIYSVLKENDLFNIFRKDSVKPIICPGTHFKHYSPEHDLILYKNSIDLEKHLERLKKFRRFFRIAILYFETEYENVSNFKTLEYQDQQNFEPFKENVIIKFKMGKNLREFSHNLYDFLRISDKMSDIIFCEEVENKGEGVAIMDRLHRAAQNKET
ncbi:Threonylcarbamoyl-AMP synthase [Cucumispora dikerogammari]|nr:Threonylcarbamoyl-AMP synthase [Cucumispora dikerogammari]